MILKGLEELIKLNTGGKLVSCIIEYKGIEITFEGEGRFVMFAKGLKQESVLSSKLHNEEDILKVIGRFI